MSAPDQQPENTRAAEEALRWMRGAQAEAALVAEVGRAVRVRRRRLTRLAGAIAVAMGLGLFVGLNRDPGAPGAPTAIVTEPRRQILPDGSVVVLRDGAEIAADFSPLARRVALRRGEAHFDVVKDRARPFVVTAQGVEVRAVGTAFSVGLGGGAAVEVLVTHGRVAVEPEAKAAALVDAGQRALVPSAGAAAEVSVLSAAEMAEASAWRVPQIEFSRTPLTEAVALINARLTTAGQRRIVADSADAGLRELRLSGYLAADNTEGFLLLLESNFGIRADRGGNGAIVLRSQR
ncbi:MAG: FecR domain-containing protein [Opitutaceae bacterium]|nr:FecR domain-containing protein [Opitutaceae bacterium]